MKNFKEIIVGVFAAFGVFVAITGFTQVENKQVINNPYGVPESHEWEIVIQNTYNSWLLNKKTGEIRLLISSDKEIRKCKVVE